MTNKFRDLCYSVISRIKGICSGALGLLFWLLLLTVGLARLWSWVAPADTGSSDTGKLEIIEVDENNPKHKTIASALQHIWDASTSAPRDVQLFIATSSDMNAASFGSGRFLFWEGTADLPRDVLEAIAAHEVAHDLLGHARSVSELKDLTDFFGEAVSLFTGSDDPTEQTLKHWFGNTMLPKYSRTQELEADGKAVELLRASGTKDPNKALLACLENLLSRYGNTGGGFFDSHPSTKERIERLRSKTDGR